MANTLRPFRQYDEHDVINMFTYDVDAAASNGLVVGAGKLVKVVGNGWRGTDDPHNLSGTDYAGGSAINTSLKGSVLSLRYNLVAEVDDATGTNADDPILGMLLHDVRTLDENDEPLKYNPRKADEMQCVIPGQAVPIVTRGIFLLHTTGTELDGAAAGEKLLCSDTGDIVDDATASGSSNLRVVGRALGATYGIVGDKHLLIKLEL